MTRKLSRIAAALALACAACAAGYSIRGEEVRQTPPLSIPAETVAAPAAGAVRVLYSLDRKQNDKEIIALIDGAKNRIYFAIYTFTLSDIADALVAAKKRGVDVRGLMDSGQSSDSYGAPITAKLLAAGIPLEVEKHPTGSGIMHIKMIVTDQAYALGSYNWTSSATTINDEILEIGTDPTLRQTYENILKKLFDAYRGSNATAHAVAPVSIGTIHYTDAPAHISDTASVQGTLVEAYTSKSGTVFLDFCQSYKTCPFSGVIFADDVKAFGGLSSLSGKQVTLTGKITSYQGQAEIVLTDPSQLTY